MAQAPAALQPLQPPVDAASALSTITGNYAAYHRLRARLEALQRWVREQYQVTNGEALEALPKPP